MTAFCALFADVGKEEIPIVISDVLVTSRGLPPTNGRYEKAYLPTIGGVFPHVSSEATISGLIQKLSLLPGGHCLAVAGDLSPILDFHAQLIQQSHDFDKMYRVCQAFSETVSFTLLVNDTARSRRVTIASESCRHLRSGQYELSIVGGSGESTLRRLLLKQKELSIRGTSDLGELSRAFFLVSEALDLDSKDPTQTLEKSFGGYYEIATYDGEKFIKFDRVAYHYVRLDIIDGENLWVLHKSIYHEYVNDDLIVRRVVWTREGVDGPVWQDCYAIGSFEKPADLRRAKAHIDDTVPTTEWEVLCFEIGALKFRTVSSRRNLVNLLKRGNRWFHETDAALLDEYVRLMQQSFVG
ncbi:hypothetical protein [Paraburkholderia caribensis]|uniref:hypothetical protein n=1 Tax=Paraburkholderia caribensis TaxID=75105 RepID=UPI001CB5A300|nr:hypothetical protein [Paraburkholderia caribensis]CAG9243703.1 conserved hypothetical protein [Paraburkholderia caribensis]